MGCPEIWPGHSLGIEHKEPCQGFVFFKIDFLQAIRTKAVWLGKDNNCKAKPLNLNWTDDVIRILGTCHSYYKQKNLKQNFSIKVQKIQTVFDMWCSGDLLCSEKQ